MRKVGGRGSGEAALLIEQIQDTHLALEQIQHILQRDAHGSVDL
jgi:hypothetical protein